MYNRVKVNPVNINIKNRIGSVKSQSSDGKHNHDHRIQAQRKYTKIIQIPGKTTFRVVLAGLETIQPGHRLQKMCREGRQR